MEQFSWISFTLIVCAISCRGNTPNIYYNLTVALTSDQLEESLILWDSFGLPSYTDRQNGSHERYGQDSFLRSGDNHTDSYSYAFEANMRSSPTSRAGDAGSGSDSEHESPLDDHAVDHHGVHAPEILYIFLTLIIGAIARYGLKMVRNFFVMPYTVFVLLLGCIYGLLEYQFQDVVTTYVSIASTDPDVILLIFLPGLIYEAAFSMQTHLFKKLFLHMLIIGSIGLAFNVVLMGYISLQMFQYSAPQFNITYGMLLSAIVSASDPIVAVSLLKEAGSARTLTTVLEGTSLLSDTSAVVLFKLILQKVDDQKINPTSDEIVKQFFINVFGGPAWGLAIGFLLTSLLSRMSSVWKAELILILITPYLVFWTADSAFDISGALATMVLGLWMSSHRTSISSDVEELVNRVWELVSLVSNTLIFSLVGIVIVQKTLSGAGDARLDGGDWLDLFVINIFLIVVRAIGFILMKPLLCYCGIGDKVFTWPHIFVLSWGGFRGAVTLALGMKAANNESIQKMPEVQTKLVFHSAGIVAFTLLFNASTMRFFLKRLGILDMPMSELITMHMALKQILTTRHQKLDALKTDRYLADADWQRVDDLTKIDGKQYGIEDGDNTSLWTIHYVTREVSCPSCEAEVQLEPLPNELNEMESIARLRLVNAKKTSYWRQYEEGTLSQSGIKYLDDLSDTVLSGENGVIGADDIKRCLHDELWTKFVGAKKKKIARFQYWIENKKSTIWTPPEFRWRMPCFGIAVSSAYRYFMAFVIIANLAETIVDWVMFYMSNFDDYVDHMHLPFMYTNLCFSLCYLAEAIIKIIGFGWKPYWGKKMLSWNRFDILLLLLTVIDIIMDFLIEYNPNVNANGANGTSVLRIFRFFKIIRFGRMLRWLKPVVPKLLHFLDDRINAHLFVAYDIAKAFMVSQEECSMMVPSVIGYKPLATKFKTQADGDCRIVLKEIGLLNEKRPDVAAAVKTRQAIRSILNHLHKSVEHMRSQGILDSHEVDHLQATIEARLKKLHHFPHSIAIVRSLDRLWNVSWINGSQDVFDVMKLLFDERQYETAAQFMTADTEADGIYVLISGVVSVTYSRIYWDHHELGEIYNSDNLRVVVDDTISPTHGPRLDYILAGGLLNEQCLGLGFPRRACAISDTVVSLLYLNAELFFKAMSTLPALEARFWRKIASNVALNILIKMGSLTDSTFEADKLRLSCAAVRLVRPGVRIVGLDEFEDIFLIAGTLTDMTTTEREAIIGPRKVPPTYREVEVRQGRPPVTDKTGSVIYPEYAILFLVPPGNRDLSTINVHDSQTNMMDRQGPDIDALRTFVKAAIQAKTGLTPADTQLPAFLQRKTPLLAKTDRTPAASGASRAASGRERRDSNVGAMLEFAKSRQRDSSQAMFNVLAYHRNSTEGGAESVAHQTGVLKSVKSQNK